MKRIINLVFLFAMSVLCFSCATRKYNASFFDNAYDWIDTDFAAENPIRQPFSDDDSFPYNRTFIVSSNEQFNYVFQDGIDFPHNFDKETIIVYTFNHHYLRKCYLSNIEKEGDALLISYKTRRKNSCAAYGDSCSPYQRWFVVKLNCLNIHSATFKDCD